jgi:hypothetical protein
MRIVSLAWIAAASFAGFAAARLGAQDAKAPPAVRASRFELVDGAGRPRAVLGISKEGAPELDLRDAEGRPRALLVLDRNSLPILLLKDADVITRARLELDAAGAARLSFNEKDQTPRFEVEASKPSARLADAKGTTVWKAP